MTRKETKEEATIDGWVARDECGEIYLYCESKPIKDFMAWKPYDCHLLPKDSFPNVKWEDDEPTPVTITIKTK